MPALADRALLASMAGEVHRLPVLRPSIRWSWSVSQKTSTPFEVARQNWLSMEALCSLNEEWMCIAIE